MIGLVESIPLENMPSAVSCGRPSGSEVESLRGEVARLNIEADALVRQVVQSFEELSLLRSMAGHLELRDSSSNALDVADESLPSLRDIVGAESLLLVTDLGDAGAHSDNARLMGRWYGPPLLRNEQAREWISREKGSARKGPVVRNGLSASPEAVPFLNVNGFILVEIRSHGQLCGWLAALNRTSLQDPAAPGSNDGFTSAEATVLSTAASLLAAHFHNVNLLRQKERLFTDLVRALVNAIEARDPYTCGHSERVSLSARRLAQAIGLNSADCERVYLAGLLHDVGKIGIHDALLGKPGRLTDTEYRMIRMHTEAGWEILHELEALQHILPGVLHHHEQYDGRGYPDGLAGEKIPIDGRILAICDSYDAMTSTRLYREGMPQQQAESLLRAGSGTQWDPQLVTAFFSIMPEIIAIREGHQRRQHSQRRSR